jgi:penicillin-binding protein 2
MSNALAQRLGHAHTMNDNAWFVGVAPRRNPDIVVAILWEGGKEGPFSARLAARVIEAYVNKQRRLENNLIAKAPPAKVEVGAIWDNPSQPKIFGGKPIVKAKQNEQQAQIRGGHFYLTVPPVTASAKMP